LANIHIPPGTADDAGRGTTVISNRIAQAPQNNRFAMTSSQEQNLLHPRLQVPFARLDLDVDLDRRQCIEPATLGASPGFLEPVRRRCHSTDKILHTHDDDGRLAAAVDDEALVVLGGEIYDLPELGPGDVSIDAMSRALVGRIEEAEGNYETRPGSLNGKSDCHFEPCPSDTSTCAEHRGIVRPPIEPQQAPPIQPVSMWELRAEWAQAFRHAPENLPFGFADADGAHP
jgi:hypothetical protein